MAELFILSVAVGAVGILTQANSATDTKTVMAPAFWGLIIEVAAALYAPYWVFVLVARAWGTAAALATFAVAGALAALALRQVRGSPGWPRLKERVLQAAIDAANVLGVLGFLALLAAGLHWAVRALDLHPAWYALLLLPLGIAILVAVAIARENRADAASLRQVFGPLLQRWNVRFGPVRAGRARSFAVATSSSGVPIELEITWFGPAARDCSSLAVRAALRDLPPRPFWLCATIRAPCGTPAQPIQLEHDEAGGVLARGAVGMGLSGLAGQFRASHGNGFCRVMGEPQPCVEVMAAADNARVPELVDRVLELAAVLSGAQRPVPSPMHPPGAEQPS